MLRRCFPLIGILLLTACAAQPPSDSTDSASSPAMMKKTESSTAAMEKPESMMEKSTASTPAMQPKSEAMMKDTESSEAAMQPTSEAMMKDAVTTEPAMDTKKPEAMKPRVIRVTADNWSFSPSMISVKKGEVVTIELVGAAGIHGLAVPGLGISQKVEPGETVSVTLPTDTAGTHSFFCNISCGSGHKDMKGTIVIEE